MKWIEGAGHNSNTDNPELINSLIQEFVSGIYQQIISGLMRRKYGMPDAFHTLQIMGEDR